MNIKAKLMKYFVEDKVVEFIGFSFSRVYTTPLIGLQAVIVIYSVSRTGNPYSGVSTGTTPESDALGTYCFMQFVTRALSPPKQYYLPNIIC